MKLHTLCLSVSIAIGLSCAQAVAQQPLRLTFGVYTSEKATEMFKRFAPVIDDMQSLVAKASGRPAIVEMKILKTYEEAYEAFLRGEVDFVRFGPSLYTIAKAKEPGMQLLAAEEDDGQKRSEGVIFVRANSPIRTLADLQQKTFAFGDESSTIGRYLAQAELVKAGITAERLRHFAYLGRHDKVVAAVQAGEFDAGSAHAMTFANMNKDGQLRVLVRFDNISKAWIARAGLDPAACSALRTALLGMRQPATLKVLGVTGFQPASDRDYDFVREGMKRANEFERHSHATPAAPKR